MAKTIGLISVKGGVGKTSLTSAIGAILAKEFHKKVLLVDANFSSPNLALHLGLTDPEVTIHHVLSDRVDIQNAVYESEHGFHIIPGAMIYGGVNPFKLRSKLKSLQKFYDYILIDSAPTMSNDILASIIASDEIYMITTPDAVTLNTTLKAVASAKKKNTPIKGLIVNKLHNKKFELSLQEMEKISHCKVLAMLPHELGVVKALSQMAPVSREYGRRFSEELKRLVAAMIGQENEPGFIDKFRNFFNLAPQQEINRAVFSKEQASSLFN